MIAGQELWFVPQESRRPPYAVTIKQVGRKWLHLSNGERIDKATLIADGHGYSSPGTAYPSREIYEGRIALQNAWIEFARKVEKTWLRAPPGVTLAQIQNAERALFKDSAQTVSGESAT